MFLFWRVRQIFVKAFKDFPEEARGHLYVLMFCFFGGWGGFGLTFNLGPEGWALINPVAHNIIVRILDSMTGSGSSADRGKKEEAKVVKFAWDPSSFS